MTTQPHSFGTDNYGRQTQSFKCKKCKGVLKGGSAHDAVRSQGGGYIHPDPPGCAAFKPAKVKAEKPLRLIEPPKAPPKGRADNRLARSETRRDDGHGAHRSSCERAKPAPRVLTCVGCLTTFTPKDKRQMYCTAACREKTAKRRREQKPEIKAKKNEDNERRRRAKLDEKNRELLARAEAGEHVHTYTRSPHGGNAAICHNGPDDGSCRVWNRQQPPHPCKMCQQPTPHGHVFCSKACSASDKNSRRWSTRRNALGWPTENGRCR